MYQVINMKGLVKLDTRREEISKRVYKTLGFQDWEFPKDDVYTPVLSTTENAVILRILQEDDSRKTVAELEFALKP